MAVFITGGTLGGSLGPLISVAVVGWVGLERSWLAMFPGLALAVALIVVLARHARHGRRAGGAAPAATPSLRELRPVLRPLTLLYFAVVARSAVSYGFMTFLPMYLHQLGYPVAFGGTALTAYLALGALGGFAGGWMAERIGGRARGGPVVRRRHPVLPRVPRAADPARPGVPGRRLVHRCRARCR